MYRGRFAPSPTGPLHFGSLVAALASYLEARHRSGEWLIRIEDVDRDRARPEAAAIILSTLERIGFRADGEIVYQSGRSALYESAIRRLGSLVYPCSCSRKEIGNAGEGRYPGTCRKGPAKGKPIRSLRVRVDSEPICFEDPLQGKVCSNLEEDLGDFPLVRTDGSVYSYQLAVVVDDEAQGVTAVVRGADLIDSTPRQIYLQRQLGYRSLEYLHIPVATGPGGEKLSKQNLAEAIAAEEAVSLLWKALRYLGQEVPPGYATASLSRIWDWAIGNWDWRRIPASPTLPAP